MSELSDEEKATLWNWQIPIDELCGSCDGKEAPDPECWLCLGTGRDQPGWEERGAAEGIVWHPVTTTETTEIESLRADVLVLRTALQSLVDAYGAFVDAHGPLTDFATNAEMVDFEIACERAGVVLGGGNDGLPANPEFDIDNDDGSF